MRTLFLIPPTLDNTADVDRCFGCNYGLYFLPLLPMLYTATILQKDFTIMDFVANKQSKADFENFIQHNDYDVYVFYTVFLCHKTDLLAREYIRKHKKNAIFIFSGPQPTYAPEDFLDADDTIVVRGEPEFVIRDIIAALPDRQALSQIDGISYVAATKIVHNKPRAIVHDIDTLPIPNRAWLNHQHYSNPKLHKFPHTAILTSRGCFGQCWYCVPNSLSYTAELDHKKCFGKKPAPRLHSVARVIEEFKAIAALGFKSVSVIDDEFLWNDERTLKICEGIKDLHLEWSCLARADKVTEKSAQALAAAGCHYVDLGIESFDINVLRAIKKNITPDDARNAISILKKYGIKPEVNVLLGATPEETEATIKNTLREVEKLKVEYVLYSIANPFPGTDFHNAAKENRWLVYGKYVPVDPAKTAIISYPHLSKEQLEKYLAMAYKNHYFNLRYILRQLFNFRGGIKSFKHRAATGLRLFKRLFMN